MASDAHKSGSSNPGIISRHANNSRRTANENQRQPKVLAFREHYTGQELDRRALSLSF